jgi:hypothetical protein
MPKNKYPFVAFALTIICLWVLQLLNEIYMGSIVTTNWLYKTPLTLKLRYVWVALRLKN